MQRTPVKSSALTSIGYSPEAEILEVEFHSSRVYQYLGVPTPEYENLIAANSIGRWFNKHIRDIYDREEVTGRDEDRGRVLFAKRGRLLSAETVVPGGWVTEKTGRIGYRQASLNSVRMSAAKPPPFVGSPLVFFSVAGSGPCGKVGNALLRFPLSLHCVAFFGSRMSPKS